MKFATIGTSAICERYITACLKTGKWELSALYSRDNKRAESFAQKFDISNTVNFYDDLQKMAEADFEVIYIASPNSLHFEQLMLFLEHGKHVICEKPLVTSMAQFDKAYELADRKNVFLIEAFRHVNSPSVDILREHINHISPVRNAIFSYNQYSSKYNAFKAGELPNIFNPYFCGGALMDLGVYPISLAAALWRRPKAWHKIPLLISNSTGIQIDGAGTVVLCYDGFNVTIVFSKTADGLLQNEIIGERGGIIFDKPSELVIMRLFTKPNGEKDISAKAFENPLDNEAAEFFRIINERDTVRYSEIIEISRITAEIIS